MTTKTWELILKSDLVKVGTHEEESYDIIRELWYVVAVDAAGFRFSHGAMTAKDEAQERLALFVLDGGVDPEASGWVEIDPVYGSLAYQFREPEIVAAERCLAIQDTKLIIGMKYDKKDRVTA